MFDWIRFNPSTKCIYVTDGSPMDEVTEECKLVSFEEYNKIVEAKKCEEENEATKTEETKEDEVVDNG